MRLNKYIALCGASSRRKAEEYIKAGRITVNSRVVTEMGVILNDNDVVALDGTIIKPEEEKIYILLNKPVGYISTANEQFDRPSVLDLIKGINERIYPVGRLDYDTSGLIILTNDGDFTNRITHPSNKIEKIYEAKIQGIPSEEEIKEFRNGLKIENYMTAEAGFEIIKKEGRSCLANVIIHEGRNRQVRKMCDAIGHPVISLKRVKIGSIGLSGLKEGKWRYLSKPEIESLIKCK